MVQPDKYNLNYLTENSIYTQMRELFYDDINILYSDKKECYLSYCIINIYQGYYGFLI